MHPACEEHLLPRPRRVRRLPGCYRLGARLHVLRTAGAASSDGATALAAALLEEHFHERGFRWERNDHASHAPSPGVIIFEPAEFADSQRYSLLIRPDEIRMRSSSPAGFYYAATTLCQLIESGCRFIQAMQIDDWPDFPARGVMLDISRDKVPTLATLRRLIDLLAGWKINQLQLYTEHTFAYAGHERVWRGASPLTGQQVEALDEYCRRRFIEMVPNQNSFGHMERWLRHEPYARLAEARGPWRTPWGDIRRTPTTLNPLDAGSIRLVAGLYDQMLPHFRSGLFNVGCDETWELGQGASAAACRRRGVGRVYLEFLRKIHGEVTRRGRRMMFWADIALKHPDLAAELPADLIPLLWGYEADHPFDRECDAIARRGLPFYVCPGTSTWCSFGGRTRNCLANIANAAAAGRRHGASGCLITDWGDFGHRQYLPASYGGFLCGAAMSWCGATNASIDVAREVSRHVFSDDSGAIGRLWRDAGAIHELSGVSLKNRTVLFSCMEGRLGSEESAHGLTPRSIQAMLRRIAELEEAASRARWTGDEGLLARDELRMTLAVLRHACRRAAVAVTPPEAVAGRRLIRALADDMRQIITRHGRLWLKRNRPGGLASSAAYYRRNLREYEATM